MIDFTIYRDPVRPCPPLPRLWPEGAASCAAGLPAIRRPASTPSASSKPIAGSSSSMARAPASSGRRAGGGSIPRAEGAPAGAPEEQSGGPGAECSEMLGSCMLASIRPMSGATRALPSPVRRVDFLVVEEQPAPPSAGHFLGCHVRGIFAVVACGTRSDPLSTKTVCQNSASFWCRIARMVTTSPSILYRAT